MGPGLLVTTILHVFVQPQQGGWEQQLELPKAANCIGGVAHCGMLCKQRVLESDVHAMQAGADQQRFLMVRKH